MKLLLLWEEKNKQTKKPPHNHIMCYSLLPRNLFFFLTEALSETKGGRTAEGEVTKTKPNKKKKDPVWKWQTTASLIRIPVPNMTVFNR